MNIFLKDLIYVKREEWKRKYVHITLANDKVKKILKSEYKKLKGIK